MSSTTCHCPEDLRDHGAGARWRPALGRVAGSLAGAAMRLHRFRSLHVAMLHEALCNRDCRQPLLPRRTGAEDGQ